MSPAPAPASAPPRPPAACLLDTAALAATTGVAWTADATTASDTRCVYDPSADPAGGSRFITVTLVPVAAANAGSTLDEYAQLCDAGSRTPVTGSGFVCRFEKRTVFGAAVRGSQVTTVTASAAPEGTTVDALAGAVAQQLRPG